MTVNETLDRATILNDRVFDWSDGADHDIYALTDQLVPSMVLALEQVVVIAARLRAAVGNDVATCTMHDIADDLRTALRGLE